MSVDTARNPSADAGRELEPVWAARRCLVDWLGCAIGGVDSSAATTARALFADCDGPSTVLGSGRSLARDAAFANATAGHALDLDDENYWLFGHPGSTVVPAVLAVAEAGGGTVGDVFAAMITGYEIAEALGRAANPEHYRAGWHSTSTLGAFSTAVACARILGLDRVGRAAALNYAAVQAGGLRAVFGSDTKALQVGAAASAGVTAALLAEASHDRPPAVVGDYLTMVGAPSSARDGDWARFEPTTRPAAITSTNYKWHATCGAAHCMIEAVAQAVQQARARSNDVTAVRIFVGDLTAETAAVSEPTSTHEAQFCLPHLAALATHVYPVRPKSLWPATPSVRALRKRCTVEVVPEFSGDGHHPARVEVTFLDGHSITTTVLHAKGTIDWPLSDQELGDKFLRVTRPKEGDADPAKSLLRQLWEMPESRPVQDLMGDVRAVADGRVPGQAPDRTRR